MDKIDSKLAHAVGIARSAYAELKKQSVDQSVIDSVRLANAKSHNMSVEDWNKLVDSKPASSGGKITESKEDFRIEADRLTNNLLHAVNHSTDVEVKTALKEMLDFDKTYQSVTGIQQSDRTDWRGMYVIAPHAKNPDSLAIYRGGWGDGSKQDRNQYSNGRRVPVAKTTGYALEQPEAIKTTKDSPNQPADAQKDASQTANVESPKDDTKSQTDAPTLETMVEQTKPKTKAEKRAEREARKGK